jgi:hypothetical protein
VSFGFRMWVVAGALCASMAAHAEYKEVWNPPEAAAGARHAGKHAKATRPVKQAAKAKPAAQAKPATQAKPVKVKAPEKKKPARKPMQKTARELPPILK